MVQDLQLSEHIQNIEMNRTKEKNKIACNNTRKVKKEKISSQKFYISRLKQVG